MPRSALPLKKRPLRFLESGLSSSSNMLKTENAKDSPTCSEKAIVTPQRGNSSESPNPVQNVILHEDPTPQSERNIASKVIQHREDTNDDSSTPHNRRPSQDSSCSKTLRLDDTSHVGPPVANHNFHSPTGNLVPHTVKVLKRMIESRIVETTQGTQHLGPHLFSVVPVEVPPQDIQRVMQQGELEKASPFVKIAKAPSTSVHNTVINPGPKVKRRRIRNPTKRGAQTEITPRFGVLQHMVPRDPQNIWQLGGAKTTTQTKLSDMPIITDYAHGGVVRPFGMAVRYRTLKL
eukprot:Lankesteria_metandrocarpae@DN5338_c0_g1_i19.p1